MTEVVEVALGDGRAYPVVVGAGALDELPARLAALAPTGVAVVTDEAVASRHAQAVMARLAAGAAGAPRHLFAVPPGEASKSPERLAELWRALASAKFDRKGVVVALGGGVVGDLAGFVAATYQRGVRFVQIPTTLLAQVDSSVGGKTGVNLPEGKNLAGAFHQPAFVLADAGVLATLPAGEWACGFAEAVKHGMALDADYFARLEDDADALADARADAGAGRALAETSAAALARLVAGSARLKAAVVAADEREAGERALLNFGHSYGHAFEKLSGYRLRHGEAVALGMIRAVELSERLRGLDPAAGVRLRALLHRLGVCPPSPACSPEAVVAAMRGDKKNEGGRFRLVLLAAVGRAEVVAVDEAELRRAAGDDEP